MSRVKKGKPKDMKKNKHPHVHIGTSGWSYDHWKKNFYPAGLKHTEWLDYYSQNFETVELNTTFYHIPSIANVKKWRMTVPEIFLFSIKASRYITHIKRLNDCENSLDYFYRSIKNFKTKAGPVLFQLPPSLKMNKDRLVEFIKLLEDNYDYVFEFRDDSWYNDDIYEILSKNKIALCITDLNGKMSPDEVTSHFTYFRLHGPAKSYVGSYGITKLKTLKKRIEKFITNSTSVFCYFDNDEKGFAIKDAAMLKKMINEN